MATATMDRAGSPETAERGTSGFSGRGKLTGWLLKRKSEGVASRLFRSANRRFFTLDFEGQLFYYAHTEGNKIASLPLAFRELLGVEPLEAMLNDAASDEQECKSNAGHGHSFRVPKISFSALKRPSAEHHGFLLRTTGKDMELLTATKEEAETWISAFQEAVAMGADSRAGVAEGSEKAVARHRHNSCTEAAEKVDSSTSAGSSPEAPLSPRSDDTDSLPEVLVPQMTAEAAAEAHQAHADFVVSSPRNHQAFGGELPEDRPKEAAKEHKAARRGLGNLLPRRLGGRPRAEVAAPSTSGEVTSLDFEATLLRDAGTTAWIEETEDEGDNKGGAVAVTDSSSEVLKRYGDKGKGLSLKERLAQMEFSDDEDE